MTTLSAACPVLCNNCDLLSTNCELRYSSCLLSGHHMHNNHNCDLLSTNCELTYSSCLQSGHHTHNNHVIITVSWVMFHIGFRYACHVYLGPDSSGVRFRRRLEHCSISVSKTVVNVTEMITYDWSVISTNHKFSFQSRSWIWSI